MSKRLLTAACALIAVGMAAGSASAQMPVPKKAKKFQANLVTAFAGCAAPNDTTTGVLALPACHPAVPNDTVCGFDMSDPANPAGQGQVQASVAGKGATADIKLKVKLQGLNAGCIGQTLCVKPFLRATSLACLSGDVGGCTTLEALTNPFALSGPACGVVDAEGALQIKTTVETAVPGLVPGGTHLTIDLSRTGVVRTTGPSLPGGQQLTFAAGIDAN
jgi:hypothetical protein